MLKQIKKKGTKTLVEHVNRWLNTTLNKYMENVQFCNKRYVE